MQEAAVNRAVTVAVFKVDFCTPRWPVGRREIRPLHRVLTLGHYGRSYFIMSHQKTY